MKSSACLSLQLLFLCVQLYLHEGKPHVCSMCVYACVYVRICHRHVGSCRKVGFPVTGATNSCEPPSRVLRTKLHSSGRAAMLLTAGPALQAPVYLFYSTLLQNCGLLCDNHT